MSTPRTAAKAPPKPKKPAPLAPPIRWKLEHQGKARFGSDVLLARGHLWFFDVERTVYRVDLDGQVQQTWKLPHPIELLLADGDKVHARDSTGALFDLSTKEPKASVQHGALAPTPGLVLRRGSQFVLGPKGVVTAYDASGDERWSVTVKGASRMGLFCADDELIYVSGNGSICALDDSGAVRWKTKVGSKPVKRAWQTRDLLYLAAWNEGVHVLDKAGKHVASAASKVNFRAGAARAGDERFYTTGLGRLTGWSAAGARDWELAFNADLSCGMCALDDVVYVVGFRIGLVCIDVSPKALEASAKGELPEPVSRTVDPASQTPAKVARAEAPSTSAAGAPGVTVECYQDGSEIRVRVVSKGYHADWACQFPRALRIAGARYQVDEVVASAKGDHYRVVGAIQRLPDRT